MVFSFLHLITNEQRQVLEAVDKEYTTFLEERAVGITEVLDLRKAVAEEEARKKSERDAQMDVDEPDGEVDKGKRDADGAEDAPKSAGADVEMEDDGDRDSATLGTAESSKELADEEEMKKEKEEPPVVPADGDDAVEY